MFNEVKPNDEIAKYAIEKVYYGITKQIPVL